MFKRFHRLRRTENLRELIKEREINLSNLVMPYFICEGNQKKEKINNMPNIYRYSIDNLVEVVKKGYNEYNIRTILLFGVPAKKYKREEIKSEKFFKNNLVTKAIKKIKEELKEIVVIADVCLCSYSEEGHCGIIIDGKIDNDETIKILSEIATKYAEAGADIIAPSAMMDGQVKIIREYLDKSNYKETAIMSYSAKFASNFYTLFREAADSSPKFGNRKSYQLDYRNINEAMREIEADIDEGADIIMIKPALSYLDVISKAKEKFNIPIAAYNVSGEYAMIKAAGEKGYIDEKEVVIEIINSIKRAGADIIITYWANEIGKWLNSKSK
ncbi:MAG TPA: porphobilinogen synthase [bacterium]|nr:porphobilinogen synthase [bacterium]HOL47117.1 porphobilinogen synthase [bacterium]HPQ18871.1 porphobilinogen synthase [bacterium]